MGGECRTDTVRPDLLADARTNARTLEDVFARLHILQAGDQTLVPPNRIDPQDPDLTGRYRDISADRFQYLAASRSGYNVSTLFTNGANSDALTCALTALNYSESAGAGVANAINTRRDQNVSEQEIQAYLGGLSPSDQRNYEIYNTLRFMHQFDRGEGSLDQDGDFSVISREDLVPWATSLGDDAQSQGEKAVVRLHVIMGLVNYFANPPANAVIPAAIDNPASPLVTGNTFDLRAPSGGWRTGDSIFINGVALAGVTVPTSGTASVTIPAASLPVGGHTIEIRRATGGVERTPVTVNTPPPPPAPAPTPTFWQRVSSAWHTIPGEGRGVLEALGVAGVAYGLYQGARRLFGSNPAPRQNGGNNGGGNSGSSDGRAEARVDVRVVTDPAANPTGGNPPADGTRVVTDTAVVPPRPAGGARVVTAAPPPAAPPPVAPPPTRTVVAAEDDMADLAAALKADNRDRSPAPGAVTPSVTPAATGITADNVIIRGADARPSAEINRSVVMAEIAYLNPRFLTEDGTAIHSNYRAGIEQLANLAMEAFGNRGANEPSAGELWRMEHGERGSMIRGGLPEAWLRQFVTGQLERWHAAGAPGMSFDATAREAMERDATRRAGERSAYERWVEEGLRDPARLAGR